MPGRFFDRQGGLYLRTLEALGPPRLILISFFFVLLIGSALLSLPISSNSGVGIQYIDALFTATSAVCVTGLVVVDTFSQWTIFGKTVILALIQIGGLGFLTLLTMFLVLIGKKISLFERVLIQSSFNQPNLQGMVKFVKIVVFGTFTIEGIGAAILTIRFLFEGKPFIKALGYGVFHSISAFCNAGFDIIGKTSLTDYVGDPTVVFVIMILIILGGLGFPVWIDLLSFFKKLFSKNRKNKFFEAFRHDKAKLQLNTKIVLFTTTVFIVFGFVFFLLSENGNPLTFGPLNTWEKISASMFLSVTPRTAGFATVNYANLEIASKFMTILLMFIGGSPSGTAGGVKTVTIALIAIAVLSAIRGKENIEIFKRSIKPNLLSKALAVIMMMLGTVIVAVMILSFSERDSGFNITFIDLLFETVSAIGTVGLSTGLTPHLSVIGKLVIIIVMFIGRIGPITMVVSLTLKLNASENSVKYPEEKVLVG